MPSNPIMQYKQQVVSTMSRGEQLILLYNEALKNLRYGAAMLKEENFPTAKKCMLKCKNIFNYLSSILNNQYAVSKELYQLYYFINQQIIRAEIKNDPALLEELIPLVETMVDTWTQAEKLSHMHKE